MLQFYQLLLSIQLKTNHYGSCHILLSHIKYDQNLGHLKSAFSSTFSQLWACSLSTLSATIPFFFLGTSTYTVPFSEQMCTCTSYYLFGSYHLPVLYVEDGTTILTPYCYNNPNPLLPDRRKQLQTPPNVPVNLQLNYYYSMEGIFTQPIVHTRKAGLIFQRNEWESKGENKVPVVQMRRAKRPWREIMKQMISTNKISYHDV